MDKYEILMDLMRYRKQFYQIYSAGDDWKRALMEDWMSCGARTFYQGDWSNLQRARNTYGPSWLYKEADEALEDFSHRLKVLLNDLEQAQENLSKR